MHSVEVFAAGKPPYPLRYQPMAPPSFRIAADGGAHLARSWDIDVDMVVGDMDSIDPQLLDQLRDAGARIVEHPVAKDLTDLELAYQEALRRGADHVRLFTGVGGRLDHLTGQLLGLVRLAEQGVEVDAFIGNDYIRPLWSGRTASVEPGRRFTVLATGGEAQVSIDGAEWHLDRGLLSLGECRGLSNRSLVTGATVRCHGGCVLLMSDVERDDASVEVER